MPEHLGYFFTGGLDKLDDLSEGAERNGSSYAILYLPSESLQIDIDLERKFHINPLDEEAFDQVRNKPQYQERRLNDSHLTMIISLKRIFDTQKQSYERTAALLEDELNSFSEYFESHEPLPIHQPLPFWKRLIFRRKKEGH